MAMNKLINRYLQEMDFYINFTMDERFVENINLAAARDLPILRFPRERKCESI